MFNDYYNRKLNREKKTDRGKAVAGENKAEPNPFLRLLSFCH